MGDVMMETLTNIFIHIMTIGIPTLVLLLCVCGILCTREVHASPYIKIGLYSALSIFAMGSALLCGAYVIGMIR